MQQKMADLQVQNENQKEIYESKIAILEKNIKEYSDVTHELMSLHQKKTSIKDMKNEGIKAGKVPSIRNMDGAEGRQSSARRGRTRLSRSTSMINRPSTRRRREP
jgi:hypothetical protein